ncbi:MAG: GTPase [Phycisphaerales bacterium]
MAPVLTATPVRRAILLTPSHAAGAIAMIQLEGDVDAMLAALRIKAVGVGGVVVRSLANIDEGLVARWSETSCLLMPHGGIGVVRALIDAIARAGIVIEPVSRCVAGGHFVQNEVQGLNTTDSQSTVGGTASESRLLFPEARSDVEALALFTLTRAASPLAVDLLLRQHELWECALRPTSDDVDRPHRSHWTYANGSLFDSLEALSPRDVVLKRLIHPPLVVMLGQSNIGKSTLTNALAKRNVSVVADEPGTTRDHVGVMLDLGGLVVRFVDTPGLRDDPTVEEAAARDIALALARRADLLLLVGSKECQPVTVATLSVGERNLDSAAAQSLTVALQSDVGIPLWRHDLAVSAKTGDGIDAFVALVRETLVPSRLLAEKQPWRFW